MNKKAVFLLDKTAFCQTNRNIDVNLVFNCSIKYYIDNIDIYYVHPVHIIAKKRKCNINV